MLPGRPAVAAVHLHLHVRDSSASPAYACQRQLSQRPQCHADPNTTIPVGSGLPRCCTPSATTPLAPFACLPCICHHKAVPKPTSCCPAPSSHRHREESATLLDRLIVNAPRLILPYVSPIQKALVSKLRGSSAAMAAAAAPSLAGLNILNASSNKPDQKSGGETGVIKSVLSTLGQLSLVAGVCGA
jgi:hypothetical protein